MADTRPAAAAAAAAAFAGAAPAAAAAVRDALASGAAAFNTDVPTGETPLKGTSVALRADVPGSPAIAALRTRPPEELLAEFRAAKAAAADVAGADVAGADVAEAAAEPQVEQVAELAPPPAPSADVAAAPARASSKLPRGPARSRSAGKAEAEEAQRCVLGEVSNSVA